jgi:hypothetical protein
MSGADGHGFFPDTALNSRPDTFFKKLQDQRGGN